MKEGTGG